MLTAEELVVIRIDPQTAAKPRCREGQDEQAIGYIGFDVWSFEKTYYY